MPRRVTTPKKLEQQSLVGFLSSSPTSSPASKRSRAYASPKRKLRFTGKRKKRISSPLPPTSDDGISIADDADSDVGAIQFESKSAPSTADDDEPKTVPIPHIESDSDSDDSDGDELSEPRMPKKVPIPRIESGDSDPVSSLDDNSDIEFEVRVGWKRTPQAKGKGRQLVDSEEEEDLQPRKRRKLIERTRLAMSDSDDLLEEIDENKIIESRFRKRDKKSTFQKNLEKLKRKKRGQSSSESSHSDSEDDGSSESVRPFKGARPRIQSDISSSSDEKVGVEVEVEDDDFIVEDGDGDSLIQLPAAFRMSTHQDLAHHFKTICQLFVHMAVRPIPERRGFMADALKTEEYFSIPLQITRRKLSGMRDSLVTSSVWKPGFKKHLEKYPELELTRLEFTIRGCDACTMGSRISTILGRLGGKPYNPLDFEPIQEDKYFSESSSDEEEENKAPFFHLGRFCASRTRVFHEFSHWEHRLYTSLLQEIDPVRDQKSGRVGFVKVAFAGGKEPPKNLKHADAVMDWLDQRGIIGLQWQFVRQMMESARKLEYSGKRGGDDLDELE